MKKDEPTLSLDPMSEDAYEQKIREFLLENPHDDGCVRITLSARSGDRRHERVLSWASPQTATTSARTLADYLDQTRESWQKATLTIVTLPPPKKTL
jgi:hypothetical protein